MNFPPLCRWLASPLGTITRKLAFRKYDPVVRKHVLFTEKKIK